LPEQPPLHPVKLPDAEPVGMSVTTVPSAKLAEHVPVAVPAEMRQSMPDGLLAIVPVPAPAPVTVTVTASRDGAACAPGAAPSTASSANDSSAA